MSLSQEELDDAREERLPDVLTDAPGLEHLEEFYSGLELTEFGQDNIAEALQPIPEDESSRGWREGEALAEAWLTDHKNCEFPWPFNRDLRHHRASLPGAELVGFIGAGTDTQFVFSQVKTSKEDRYPPQVVNRGDKSLIKQTLQLRDDKNIKKTLVHYILQRATLDNGLVGQARVATKKWLESNYLDLVIFGVLIRDVPYSQFDLSGAAETLCEGCHPATRIEFIAIYLPEGAIPGGPQHRPRERRRHQ